jgi:tetratricopeptide (TPR) repeat protein
MPSSLQQGINAAKAGQTTKALEHLKDAIIEEPQNADVWVWIAAIIEDPEKQEIFLNKALEIDPHNIPAQRGLSYLQKRMQHEVQVKGEALSDQTQPISPFPKKNRSSQLPGEQNRTESTSDALVNLTFPDVEVDNRADQREENQGLPHLTAFEIILLCVVVIVFAFIGLLASSALFGFDLPWGSLTGNRPRLTAEPPYPGVFLYEQDVFFDMEAHEGPPVANVGIPTSASARPVVLFWGLDVDTNTLKLIHESGSYVDFRLYQSRGEADLVQPSGDLQEGLYCLQEPQTQPPSNLNIYYCFQVEPTTAD